MDLTEFVGETLAQNNKYYFMLGCIHAQATEMAQQFEGSVEDYVRLLIHELTQQSSHK